MCTVVTYSSKFNTKNLCARLSGRPGFTTIDFLLAISMMAIFAGVMIPMYRQIQVYSDLDTATENLVQAIRTAQTLSQTGKFDSMWGIHFPTGTLYTGTNYASRNNVNDVSYPLSNNFMTTGLTELSFTRLDGLPNTTGTVCIYSLTSASYRTIIVSGKGVLTISKILKGFCSGT